MTIINPSICTSRRRLYFSLLLFLCLCLLISYLSTDDESINEQATTQFTSASRRLYDQLAHRTANITQKPHKRLHPLDASDKYGFFFATLGLIVAAGGGIGGGGVLVPIFILVMGFSPKHAIPLSNITVFGGAIANTMLNYPKRHPLADRPLVDWDLILVMEPLTIAGALLGAFLNKVLREEVLVVSLVLLLSYTAYTTLNKAIKMYKKETAALVREEMEKESEMTKIEHGEHQDDEIEVRKGLLENMEDGDTEEHVEEIDLDEVILDEKDVEDLKNILEEERHVPSGNVLALVAMFIVVLFINVMKGGGAYDSPLGIRCGSTSFWIANVIMLGWILIISLFARSHLLNKFKDKVRVKYPYVEGDIQWDARATVIYPIICMLAGFFAGMFGVGGGIVKGPLMLAMGVHPSVSSASSACMILFTSFTATTSFMVFGLLIPEYAAVCVVVGFAATWIGQLALWYLMAKFNRNSYIAFSIGGIVLLSVFLMTIQSLVSLAEGHHEEPGGIC